MSEWRVVADFRAAMVRLKPPEAHKITLRGVDVFEDAGGSWVVSGARSHGERGEYRMQVRLPFSGVFALPGVRDGLAKGVWGDFLRIHKIKKPEVNDMSRCSMFVFKDGVVSHEFEWKNGHGAAARVWDALYNKYLHDGKPYSCWLNMRDFNPLWNLWKDSRLSEVEQRVQLMTFDRAIIRRENFRRAADDLDAFEELHPSGNKVSHLCAWAEKLRELADDEEIEAVGFQHTSVGENLFVSWEENPDPDSEEEDICIRYNINTGEKHFEVFKAYEEETSSQEDAETPAG